MRLPSVHLWVRRSSTGLLFLALVVGAGAGLGAIVFRWLIQTFTHLFTGFDDYSAQGHVANPNLPGLGKWFVLFTPVVAGILYGPLVHFFAREARGHGVPEVMYAVARRGGRIAPQVAGVKALASALCIGGGGSVGREGPIVQIGSALGSTLGRITRVAEPRMRVLVACGAAGGIAATFNAPLAGVFFAMELILRDFTAEAFGMVVVSSVTASVIGRAALGDSPFLTLPSFHVEHLGQYGLFILLGVIAGGIGVLFSRVLYWIEDLCDDGWKVTRLPEWLRPALGGLLLGTVLLVLPEMYGVGYPVLGNGIAGAYTIGFLVVLLCGKMIATSLTIGIGGSGGVFAPSLFIGAMLGSAYGQIAHDIAPGIAGPAGAYGLIGMGAVFAGAARAPITAVVIMFELTGEYTIILPLMAAIVMATGVSKLLTGDTIYTLKLRRRGVDLDEVPRARVLTEITASEVLEPPGAVVRETDRLADVAEAVARSPFDAVIVVGGARGAYQGVLSARALADALADGLHDTAYVSDFTELPTAVSPSETLDDALDALDGYGAVPVVQDDAVEGWLTLRRILAAQSESSARPGAAGSPQPAGRVSGHSGQVPGTGLRPATGGARPRSAPRRGARGRRPSRQ